MIQIQKSSTKVVSAVECPNCESNNTEYLGRNEIRKPQELYRCRICGSCWRK